MNLNDGIIFLYRLELNRRNAFQSVFYGLIKLTKMNILPNLHHAHDKVLNTIDLHRFMANLRQIHLALQAYINNIN